MGWPSNLACVVVNFMVLLLDFHNPDSEPIMIFAFPFVLSAAWIFTMYRCSIELLKTGFRTDTKYHKSMCYFFSVSRVLCLVGLVLEIIFLALSLASDAIKYHPTYRAVAEVLFAAAVVGVADLVPTARSLLFEIRDQPGSEPTEPRTRIIKHFPSRFQRWLMMRFPELKRYNNTPLEAIDCLASTLAEV